MTNFQSLIFYLSCFMLSALLVGMGEKRNFKPLTIIGLMIPIFIAGLRYNVGTDYKTYIDNISWLGGASISTYVRDFSSYLEPTFYVFAHIANSFSSPHIVFFTYSTISVIYLYKALKMSEIEYMSLAYFLILTMMFPMSFNMVRQFAAIAVALYATTLLYKGDKKKFFTYTIFATLLHTSALVNIVAFILYRRIDNKNRRSVSFIKLLLNIIGIAIFSMLCWYGLQKYGYLLSIENVTANLSFIPRLFILSTVLTLRYTSKLSYEQYKLYIYLGTLSVLMGIVGFFVPYGDRLSLYFLPFLIMLLPTSINKLMPRSKKHLTILGVVSIGVLYFTVSYYILGSHAIMPYKTILGSLK